jgi:hypothetical protein
MNMSAEPVAYFEILQALSGNAMESGEFISGS